MYICILIYTHPTFLIDHSTARRFVAQAYDLRDPWSGPGSHNYGRCTTNTSIRGYCGAPSSNPKQPGGNACCNCGPTLADSKRCRWTNDLPDWNANMKPLAPLIRNGSATPFFMGPIHPVRDLGQLMDGDGC